MGFTIAVGNTVNWSQDNNVILEASHTVSAERGND